MQYSSLSINEKSEEVKAFFLTRVNTDGVDVFLIEEPSERVAALILFLEAPL